MSPSLCTASAVAAAAADPSATRRPIRTRDRTRRWRRRGPPTVPPSPSRMRTRSCRAGRRPARRAGRRTGTRCRAGTAEPPVEGRIDLSARGHPRHADAGQGRGRRRDHDEVVVGERDDRERLAVAEEGVALAIPNSVAQAAGEVEARHPCGRAGAAGHRGLADGDDVAARLPRAGDELRELRDRGVLGEQGDAGRAEAGVEQTGGREPGDQGRGNSSRSLRRRRPR